MPPKQGVFVGNQHTCQINPNGQLSIPRPILRTLGWEIGDPIQAICLEEPLVLLLERSLSNDHLMPVNRRHPQRAGAMYLLNDFIMGWLPSRVALPLRQLMPIPVRDPAEGPPLLIRIGVLPDLALVLEEPQWVRLDFSPQGVHDIDRRAMGIYELILEDGRVDYIGNGVIYDQISQHLEHEAFAYVRRFRYAVVEPREDSEVVMQVWLARYKQTHDGQVPERNLSVF